MLKVRDSAEGFDSSVDIFHNSGNLDSPENASRDSVLGS
jgi:hypothetical protein